MVFNGLFKPQTFEPVGVNVVDTQAINELNIKLREFRALRFLHLIEFPIEADSHDTFDRALKGCKGKDERLVPKESYVNATPQKDTQLSPHSERTSKERTRM